MKKKQLLAFILAGSLVMGMLPAAVLAEEAPVEATETAGYEEIMPAEASEPAITEAMPVTEPVVETTPDVIEETTSEIVEQMPTETPMETPTDIPMETPTEAPTDTPTQAPTETPVENPDFTAPSEGNNEIIIDYSQNASLIPDGTVPEETEKTYIPIAIGDVEYATLAEAIAAVPDSASTSDPCTEIIISTENLELAQTVEIPANKNVSIVAGIEAVTFSRADGFYGDMFHVNGGVLNLLTGEILNENGEGSTGTVLNFEGDLRYQNEQELPIGSFVYVDEGVLAINEGVHLSNNEAAVNGGAIRNDAEGIVVLTGGSVSHNTTTETGAGIYSEGSVYVQNEADVSNNKDEDENNSNVVLSGENGKIVVTDKLYYGIANIPVQSLQPAEGMQLVFLSEEAANLGVTWNDVLDVVTYEGEGYTFDENGLLKITEKEPEVTVTPTPGVDDPDVIEPVIVPVTDSIISGLADAMYFYPEGVISGNKYTYYGFEVTGAGMDNIAPSDGDNRWNPIYWSYSENPAEEEKNTVWTLGTKEGIANPGTYAFHVFFQEEVFDVENSGWTATGNVSSIPYSYKALQLFELKGVSYTWVDETTASVTFRTNKAAKYFVDWVERAAANQQQPNHSDESMYVDMTADKDLTITLRDLDAEKPINVYAYAIDNEGGIKRGILFELSESTRPHPASREPIVPNVTESKVTGLEKALEFYPNKFFDFTVVGAGTDNKEPIAGDVKWVPVYWSTSSNPSSSQKHTTWKIGAAAGITSANTYNLYVFYQKYTHNGTKWVVTDTISPVSYQFKSAAITITPTPGGSGGNSGGSGSGYYDEDGNYVYYEGDEESDDDYNPNYYEDDTDETGAESISKNAVDTADNAPLGNLFSLLTASLAAGLYVFFKKRKNVSK